MISSISNPKVKKVRRLQVDKRYRAKQQQFVVEGTRWIGELTKTLATPQDVFYTEDWLVQEDHTELIDRLQCRRHLVVDGGRCARRPSQPCRPVVGGVDLCIGREVLVDDLDGRDELVDVLTRALDLFRRHRRPGRPGPPAVHPRTGARPRVVGVAVAVGDASRRCRGDITGLDGLSDGGTKPPGVLHLPLSTSHRRSVRATCRRPITSSPVPDPAAAEFGCPPSRRSRRTRSPPRRRSLRVAPSRSGRRPRGEFARTGAGSPW